MQVREQLLLDNIRNGDFTKAGIAADAETLCQHWAVFDSRLRRYVPEARADAQRQRQAKLRAAMSKDVWALPRRLDHDTMYGVLEGVMDVHPLAELLLLLPRSLLPCGCNFVAPSDESSSNRL